MLLQCTHSPCHHQLHCNNMWYKFVRLWLSGLFNVVSVHTGPLRLMTTHTVATLCCCMQQQQVPLLCLHTGCPCINVCTKYIWNAFTMCLLVSARLIRKSFASEDNNRCRCCNQHHGPQCLKSAATSMQSFSADKADGNTMTVGIQLDAAAARPLQCLSNSLLWETCKTCQATTLAVCCWCSNTRELQRLN